MHPKPAKTKVSVKQTLKISLFSLKNLNFKNINIINRWEHANILSYMVGYSYKDNKTIAM